MSGPTVLILAAGEGTRMRSSTPKMLHEVCGRPMVAWPVLAAREAGAERVVAIVSPDRDISGAFPEGTETVVQPQPDGTGGALRAAADVVAAGETVVVLSGDSPLVTAELISELIEAHAAAGAAATVTTIELEDPGSYGRVVRDSSGTIERIAETKTAGDATDAELAIREVNAGTYAFAAAPLAEALGRLSNDNAQGEYYLPDVLPLLREAGHPVAAHRVTDLAVTMGINDRADLALVTEHARRRILRAHMLAGVTIVDPGSTWIDADVELAPDVRLEPGTSIRGRSSVGAGSAIGPMTTLIDSALGERVTAPHSYLVECRVADGAEIGPFAYLRPAADLGADSKAGAFVEVKNSTIGPGAKVPHLSYVGDADVGAEANLGAGTITANWDGFRKYRTKIGDRARVGVDTSLVAPVDIGESAYTGAGSVIAEDVPPGSLGIVRAEQKNVEGYAERRKAKEAEQDDERGSK